MTRMWGVDPRCLCKNHLLGEHNEIHKLVGNIESGNSIEGYIEKGHIDTSEIQRRHEELKKEMERRGYNHDSPLNYNDELNTGQLDIDENINELRERCSQCKKRIDNLRN